jgi:hypothetical protein
MDDRFSVKPMYSQLPHCSNAATECPGHTGAKALKKNRVIDLGPVDFEGEDSGA